MKIKKQVVEYYTFYCQGCKYEHTYTVFQDGTQWIFNGDMEFPTFTPSLLNRKMDLDGKEISRCHLYVTNGKIVYCNDCTHSLSGQTVDLGLIS